MNELLQRLRDQLRALPPEFVAAADWSTLGDTLAAAGRFPEATEAHHAAADAARALAERTAEAEAEYKQFRDACETGNRDAALAAFRRAVDLAPERFTPFDLHRYHPEAVLGLGGFGTVFLASDRYTRVGKDRQPLQVAIKAVHDTGWNALLERDLAEVFDEADTLSALNHPGIVKTLNRGFGDPARQKRPFVVMDYFPGVTLDALMRARGNLPLADVLAIARQVAAAVHAAHQAGILHRDIKPANVMVRFDEGTGQWQIKVVDFGLAVKLPAARTSQEVPSGRRTALDRSLAGTLRYAPPEQRNDLDAPVGAYSDVYAWGKTCFDLLFATTEPRTLHWKTLPAESREWVQDLLERATIDDLGHRIRNFEEVLSTLDGVRPGDGANAEERKEMAGTVQTLLDNPPPVARSDRSSATEQRTPTPTIRPVPNAVLAQKTDVSAPKWNEPPANPKPGDVFSLRILEKESEHRPGEILTVTIPEVNRGPKPGTPTTLTWKPVPARPNPHQ